MTQNNEWKELCKSIIILRARDEWWNGSDESVTLSDIQGFDKIESFILSEKQKSRDEVFEDLIKVADEQENEGLRRELCRYYQKQEFNLKNI